MCGRYELCTDTSNEEMKSILKILEKREAEPYSWIGDVFPGCVMPVICKERQHLTVCRMMWGYPRKNGGVVINARREGILSKPFFMDDFVLRRCVIPSTGFYEWSHHDKSSQKYKFSIPSSEMLYMAGVYHIYNQKPYFVILTGAANASVSSVHHRMPVVLERNEVRAYLMNHRKAQDCLEKTLPMLNAVPC